MDNIQIKYIGDLPKEIDDIRQRGQIEYESSRGVACDYREFSIVADTQSGTPIGVLCAYQAYAEIYIDDIWVDPDHRRKGIGAKLLDAVELKFIDKGFDNINLVTNQFQAVEFYKKCGFEIEFIRVNKTQPKLTKTFFIKYFPALPGKLNIFD